MLLTDDERDRFASYLEHEAATDEGIIAQMESIKAPEAIVKKIRAEALAAKVIAAKLRSIEKWSVGT